MKKMTILAVLALSTQAFATEFKAHISDTDCTISSKGVVTRTQTFGRDVKASFTETKTITLSNIDALLPKILEISPERAPNPEEEYTYSMTHEGKTYTLSANDSKESMTLVRIITNSCR